MDLKTFAEWAAQGRSVIKGEHAETYRVAPDFSAGYAVFREDQTMPIADENMADWIEISADEWKAQRNTATAKKLPKIKIDWDETTNVTSIWCGNNAKLIEWLKGQDWAFNMRTHRWNKRHRDPVKLASQFEDKHYRVDLGPGLESRWEQIHGPVPVI